MGGLVIHAVAYVAVNAMLVFFWWMSIGSTDDLDTVASDPSTAADLKFWPLLVMVPWGVALLIHATTVLVNALPGRRRRRRKERDARRAEEKAQRREDREAQRRLDREAAREAAAAAPPVPSEPTRQWTVVMFTDIARSTPLAETMGDEAWADIVAEHRRVVRQVLGAHDGTEVGTQGDGFLCRFAVPDAAVDAAVDLQRTLAAQRDGGAFTPEVRVGLHAGEAIDGHDDLLGSAVNLAARVMAAAEPGEILVTEPVADHLRPGRDLDDRGLFELKGITRARHLLAVRWDENAEIDLRREDQPRT